jgi:hypothetical protein
MSANLFRPMGHTSGTRSTSLKSAMEIMEPRGDSCLRSGLYTTLVPILFRIIGRVSRSVPQGVVRALRLLPIPTLIFQCGHII